MNKKYFIIILIIVIIAIFIALWTNKSSENSKTTESVQSNQQVGQYKNYSSQTLKVSFDQPEEWPNPKQYSGIDYSDSFSDEYISGGRPASKSLWKLELGLKEKGACEGEDCYQYFAENFAAQNPERILKALQSDDLVEFQSDTIINGNRVFKYVSGGICGEQYAYIFGKYSTISLLSRCGGEGEGDPIFNKILSTFRFIQ